MAGPAAASRLPTILTVSVGNEFAVRPSTIDYSGTGTGVIGKFSPKQGHWHWQRWNRASADGTGTIWIDDCVPLCIAGTFHAYNGNVLANRVRNGHFTLIKLQYRYQGRTVTDIRGLAHVGAYYSWYIIGPAGL